MPKEYVESINYEYNKVDRQTYINVNVVRPNDKPKPEITKTKSSLKAPTGPSLTQKQREELLAQQQLQQQQELFRQQQLQEPQQLEQQRLEQEQQRLEEEEQQRLEQEELDEQQRLEEEQALSQQQQELEKEATLTGKSYKDELIKIELRKLELKELDLRRKEIRDLETRRNELLNSITALRSNGTQRRGYSHDAARSYSSVSRSTSVGSLHKSRQSRIHTSRVSYAPTVRTVPAEQPAATLRPPAPSNYQNENLVQQPSTRTIAQLPEPSKQTQRIVSNLTPTLVERTNNQHKLPTSTQYERELGLPTASQWVRAVQNENKQVWFQKSELSTPANPFAQQQAPPTFGANPFNTTPQQQFPQFPTQTANLSNPQFATQFPTQTANFSNAQFATQFQTPAANLSNAQFATQFPMSQFGQQQNFSNPLLAQGGAAQQFYQQNFF
ncbi:unnamed protein product [Brachionus calyciflorus]|uniref:Uncharacterized protein n=1 Tax=Brachionus calyciflorus TaxID=104777 RepID=A0A813PSG8_9BILA|nr:unnamed protein product [Brachionus calyciflorus]